MQRFQTGATLCVLLIMSSCTWASPSTQAPAIQPQPTTITVGETASLEAMPSIESPGPILTDATRPSEHSLARPQESEVGTSEALTPLPAISASTLSSARPAPPTDPGTDLAITVDGSGTNERLQIALTFDAGEDVGYAEAILDYLQDEHIAATFGMTGAWAEKHPELVRRMVAEGHQLINHSFTHASFTGVSTGSAPLTPDEMRDELERTEQLVAEITGGYVMKPYFRFPYQDWTNRELAVIDQAGYYLNIFWTCDTWGWKLGATGTDVAERCTTAALPHEITLLHVGAAAAADFEGLPALVDFYRNAGYEFVTVEQMLQP
jgi:peptidoglycan/xylan/chitin deacetylase (PgdA/CDA1 family)